MPAEEIETFTSETLLTVADMSLKSRSSREQILKTLDSDA